MSFSLVPTLKTYADADNKQQTSLSFSFDYSDQTAQNEEILGQIHTAYRLSIDTRAAGGSAIPPPFRSLAFKMFFYRQPEINQQQGELVIVSRDTNYSVSFAAQQFNNNTDTQIYMVSGVVPIEMTPGGKLDFLKITNAEPDGSQSLNGYIVATLLTKQLPAYVASGMVTDEAPANGGQ